MCSSDLKAIDNIDKPWRDANDFSAGRLKIGHKDFATPKAVAHKNLLRRHYHDLYAKKLREPAAVKFFGEKVVASIIKQIDKLFEDAMARMEAAAGLKNEVQATQPAPHRIIGSKPSEAYPA